MILDPRLDVPDTDRPWWARLGWMALYWAGSVAVLGVVATVIKWSVR